MTPSQAMPPYQIAMMNRSERRIERLLRALHEASDFLVQTRGQGKGFADQLAALRTQHPEYAATDVRLVARHWAMIVAPLAICTIDIFVLSSVAEWLASTMFPDQPRLVQAARLLVALAVVLIEVGLSSALHAAEEQAEESEDRLSARVWWVLALGWAAFISGCLVATQMAAGAENEASTKVLMYALAGFCFLLHVFLPLTHNLLHEAKGYFVFRVRTGRWVSGQQRSTREEGRIRIRVTITFQHYARDLNRHNGQFPASQMPAGPFSVVVRTVVNEIFGEGTIPVPANAGATVGAAGMRPPAGPETGAAAPPAPDGGAAPAAPQPPGGEPVDGENEYLRTVLSQRQRDEESEVRA